MADEPKKLKIIDNPAIVESYINKLIGTSFDGSAIVITLGATRFVPEHNAETVKEGTFPPVYVTARLAISPASAVELVNALNNMLKALSQIQQKASEAKPS